MFSSEGLSFLGVSVARGSLVQPSDKFCHRGVEGIADSQKCGDGNRAPGLNLLPVPGGEAETNHILLAVPPLPPQVADASAQSAEEYLLIDHAEVCRIPRAELPRAD